MFDFMNELNDEARAAMEREAKKTPRAHPFDLWLRARRAVFSADFRAVSDICATKFMSSVDHES